jgi:rfaE bifunctional protein kinase chain/domain
VNTIEIQNLSKSRLQHILDQYAGLHIGVIGDLALDVYWHADMTRSILSRETPQYPRPVVEEKYSCGAGANVADNVKALGVRRVSVISVLGDDWRGTMLQQTLAKRSIDCSKIITSHHRSTTAYIKPILLGYESQQEDARIDFENTNPLSTELENEVVDVLKQYISSLDALIITDQLDVNGIITTHVRNELINLASSYTDKVFSVDSRNHISKFKHIVLKPNEKEAIHATEYDIDTNIATLDDLITISEKLYHQAERPIFLTLGAQGMLAYTKRHVFHCLAGPTHPPLDPVGAGDTCISALTASLAAGADYWEAAVIANLASAVTVEKLNQTGTASISEILAKYNLASDRIK